MNTANVPQRDNMRKERIGIVVSDKMQKTIVVQIQQKGRHPFYGKVVSKTNKFKVHDEKDQAKAGDRVRIVETRPLSKDKHWRLVEILSHGRKSASEDLKETVA